MTALWAWVTERAAMLAVGALVALLLAVGGWGVWHWAGHQAALAEAASLRQAVASLGSQVKAMGARQNAQTSVDREPEPAGRLLDEWSRD